MAHGRQEYEKHVRTYGVVFAALGLLTVVTVAVSYLPLAAGPAILLALLIATVKASLVACFFMHLINEKQAITGLLVLTGLFLLVLLVTPVLVGLSDLS